MNESLPQIEPGQPCPWFCVPLRQNSPLEMFIQEPGIVCLHNAVEGTVMAQLNKVDNATDLTESPALSMETGVTGAAGVSVIPEETHAMERISRLESATTRRHSMKVLCALERAKWRNSVTFRTALLTATAMSLQMCGALVPKRAILLVGLQEYKPDQCTLNKLLIVSLSI